ncbi:aminopeptidase [Asanoa ishikariensis]|uniref:Xaa-Pro aminopeptidase n=1 Tax=Asanoa ishikariensis TaxID=137265 RepID=A0A1H3UCX8_9ACTN|nr:Xaa-Pro peptidase family protein [Asanoa ishikariensis]GIF63952.1 aminopeptidase [Asanoa ishikariensis]SDZ59509.1 Xaa-Pro aminopeptidase [Asanoa ishikariensis]
MAEQVSFHPEREFDEALGLLHDETLAPPDLGGREPAYPDFPTAEHQLRYARLTRLLEAYDLDALVLTQEETIRYLSGYVSVIWAVGRWLPGCMIATRDPRDAVLIPSAFDVGAAHGTSWVGTIDGHPDPMAIPDKVSGHLERLGLRAGRIGMETGAGAVVMLPWPAAQALVKAVDPVDATKLISTLRMVKTPAEVDRLRAAVTATTAGYRAAMEAARAGMTERELVGIAAATMFGSGITAGTKPVYLNCVAGRDRYGLVDTTASDRPLAEGDVVFLDGGGARDGYISDIIRLIAIGRISDEAERYAAIAGAALDAAIATIRPGVRVSEVFGAGQAVFDAEGVGGSGGGLSGHGIGLELWERPFVRDHTGDPVEDVALRPGMTLSIEPILMPSDDAGLVGVFVFENQIHVTADGAEVLSGDLETRLWRAPA